jgi:formate dehydrogenase iron-sulfur subunit
MVTTIYVPRDSAALSLGADEVAARIEEAAFETGRPIRVVRNGSHGMLWLEPLVEVVTERGRIGYGPVEPDAVGDLVAAGLLDGADHELCQGVVADLPWLRDQTRLCFARVGVTDPLSPGDFVAHGGLT